MRAPVELLEAFSVAHQAAGFHVFAIRKYRWQSIPQCEVHDQLPLSDDNAPGAPYHECLGAFLGQYIKRALDILQVSRIHRYQLQTGSRSRSLRGFRNRGGIGLVRIPKHPYAG
jgi:hypothetical protein